MRIILILLLSIRLVAEGYQAVVDEALKDYYEAAKVGNVTVLREEFKAGVPIGIADSRGYTALIYAAYYGQEDTVDFLLEQGADPCQKDLRGNSALMGAIFKGNFRIALRLMNTACSVNTKNHAEQTALMYASLFGRKDIAEKLIERGADKSLMDQNGFSAKSLAVSQGNDEMLDVLGQ
jgi:ankyrin repeat protein